VESSIAGHTPEPLDVDLKDNRGLTPLNCTAIKGDLHFLKFLIEKGGARIDEPSPKGCTALLYAARGGYADMVKYLLEKGANSLHQDNSGGTVAHHALEKDKAEILEILVEYSVDMDIADNAGRTPLFEAIDNNKISAARLLVSNGARVDITDYSGHTPLYCAARDGNEEILKILIDVGKAKVDHFGKCHNPRDLDEEDDMEYENEDEKLIMQGLDASKTPLHVAALLGYKEIITYLIHTGKANPNVQGEKGYNALHFSVLGKQPEITQYLLTNTKIDYSVKADDGKEVRDLIEDLMPMYLPHYDALIGSLPAKRIDSTMQGDVGAVATHYYNPDDDREITGVQNNEEVNKLYHEAKVDTETKDEKAKKLYETDEDQIKIEQDKEPDAIIERVFGMKTALGLISTSWKFREEALKHIHKTTPNKLESDMEYIDTIKACCTACNLAVQDKVMKVFNMGMTIFNFLVSSSKLEEKGLDIFVRMVTEFELITKLLEKSEEGNNRISNKAQEGLVDFSFHPMIGEGFVSTYLLSRLESHQKNNNTKGIAVMLALLQKFMTSFGISKKDSPLAPKKILKAIIPPLFHKDPDIRNSALKILLEIQRKTGCIDASIFKDINIPSASQSLVDHIVKKVSEEEVEQNDKSKILLDDDEERDEQNIDELKDKGKSKDWAHREIALNKIKEELKSNEDIITNSTFANTCVELLSSCLEENNISIYLVAVEVVNLFFTRCLARNYDILINTIDSLVQPLTLRTNDTNTRVRKKSTEVILDLWNNSFININQKYASFMQDSDTSVSSKIASLLMDPKQGEKSVLGRINVYSKRIQDLANTNDENNKDILNKPHQVLLGANYTTITEFAMHWCLHKNTKVRQLALRLIVDLCKYNMKDPNGGSFKQKIINYILGLKPSLRGPLITKINSVCKTAYIDAEAVGVDIAMRSNQKNMSRSKSKDRGGDLSSFKRSTSMPRTNLPEINSHMNENNPIVVLPYYEPMKDDVVFKFRNLINIFNEDIIGCFVSQSWSNRQAALDKILEQLPNLDENTRDAMKSEINKFNLPIEECFTGFCQIILEGIKDPVLKIYLSVLNVMQQGLPMFFRKLPKATFKVSTESVAPKSGEDSQEIGLGGIIKEILKKTSDLKLKLRVASKNMCIYLAHQSTIGPEQMANVTIEALQKVTALSDKGTSKSSSVNSKSDDATSSLCNSTMWTSCISLLTEYQKQAKLAKTADDSFTKTFMGIVNASLKHHTPSVRKEAEVLFIELYRTLGHGIEKMLVDQKQAVTDKLITNAKKECGISVKSESQKEEEKKANANYIASKVKNDFLPESIIKLIGQETIEMLKSANPKKRQKALVEVKKIVSKLTVNLTDKRARELSEPITYLMRQILSDDSSEVYLEALKIVRFIITSLAPHLGALDLHILIGSFIGIIVSNTVSSNIRIQVASDKVVIFFAKHNNIGPFVVARDIIKNIEKICFAIEKSGTKKREVFSEKKSFLIRFLSILLLLVNQFSIVLCYEADFNDKMISCLAQLVENSDSDQNIRSLVSQVLAALHAIDQQTLTVAINKLDPIKKAPLLKIKVNSLKN
jgi:ankyrin repeat protein